MPSSRPTTPSQLLAATYDEDRYRDFERRAAHRRALLEPDLWRPSYPARLASAVSRFVRRDRHSLTSYACRLPDGKIGRTAVVLRDGDWTVVCRVA